MATKDFSFDPLPENILAPNEAIYLAGKEPVKWGVSHYFYKRALIWITIPSDKTIYHEDPFHLNKIPLYPHDIKSVEMKKLSCMSYLHLNVQGFTEIE